MLAYHINFTGFLEIARTIDELGPAVANAVYGPSLLAMARVVSKRAKQKNFVFRDGTGIRPFDAARGRDSSRRLRTTIRHRAIPAEYYGQRYKRGRAKVYAGGPGARHAFLVHQGHGPPIVAKPYRFLTDALELTGTEQLTAFIAKASQRYPVAARRAIAKGKIAGRGGGRIQTFARTSSRRGRRG